MTTVVPKIGHWYQEGNGPLFEIVTFEPDEASVQVQYLDGELADFDLETWGVMAAKPAAAPEDWRTAFELDDGSSVDPDAALHPVEWDSPLTSIEPDAICGVEDI
ncbi:MAG: DUF6763 family protein [Congregibacter sp.]